MKLRLLHCDKPNHTFGTKFPAPCDTLSMVSVASVTLTPEGEITEINAQAYKALRLGGGNFPTH